MSQKVVLNPKESFCILKSAALSQCCCIPESTAISVLYPAKYYHIQESVPASQKVLLYPRKCCRIPERTATSKKVLLYPRKCCRISERGTRKCCRYEVVLDPKRAIVAYVMLLYPRSAAVSQGVLLCLRKWYQKEPLYPMKC